MIQFNLLPDIKLEYLKARRAKRSIMLISTIVSAVAIGLFVLLFLTVNVFQQNHINNLTSDIEDKVDEISKIEDLDKILTVQSQLNSLNDLHSQKPVATRFYEYLPQIVPENISLASVKVNFSESTIVFSGASNSLATINTFVDTLKFTTFSNPDDEDATAQNAFSQVALASFGVNEDEISYEINLTFDPLIFDSAQPAKLTVPNIVTTRSATDKPSVELFQQQTEEEVQP